MKPLLKIVVCAAVLVAGLSAKADLFFYEPFPTSYTNGGTLVTLPNGSTLAGTRLNDQTAVWGIGQGGGGGSPTNTFGAALQHGTLAYSNGSCGLYLSTNTTSGNRTRGVLLTNTPINTGSVYMSFLLNVQVASTGNRLFSLFSSAITGSPGASTVAGVWVNATTNLMLSKGSSSTPGATSATSLTPGTHLIVMRYTYNSGSTTDDQMDLWIDPSSLGGGTIPSSDLVNTAGTDISTLSSFYIYHPSSGYVPAGLFVDEIRVGTTWAEVTPTGVCTPAGAGTGPTNQASVVGSTASFAVAPVGTLPNYQWQLSTDNGTSWNNVAANGNTANYTTPTLIGADNGSRFRCVITVPCDSSSATSAVATLTVADPTGKWFRSVASGNWNANATWELSTDGLTWVAANVSPSALASNITIRASHVVTVTAAANADDLTIAVNGELDASGATLTINNGSPALDCTVNGILKVANTAGSSLVTTGAGVQFNNGGSFKWSLAAAPSLPLATWADGSTCRIEATASAAAFATNISGQSFYDLTWDTTAAGQVQRCRWDIQGTATTVRHDLSVTIPDTANASLTLGNAVGAVLTVGRHATFATGASVASTKILFNNAASQSLNLKVGGNFASTGYLDGFGASTVNLEFTGTSPQSLVVPGDVTHLITSGVISYQINGGATVNLGSLIPGSASVTVNSNATFNIGSNKVTGTGTFTVGQGATVGGDGINQLTAGFANVTYGGTLNLGTLPAFGGGETFVVFGGAAYTGSLTLVPSTPGLGFTWDTAALNTTGTLGVSAGGGNAAGYIASTTVSGGNLILTLNAGTPNTAFSVITSTNLSLARSGWTVQGTGTFDGSGNASYTNALGGGALFYSIRVP